jgi:hypothetical protein
LSAGTACAGLAGEATHNAYRTKIGLFNSISGEARLNPAGPIAVDGGSPWSQPRDSA